MNHTLENVPPAVRTAFGELARAASEVFGEQLLGLVAFGEALAPHADSASTIRSVLVLRVVDLHAVDRLAVRGEQFGRLRLAAPLVMTPEYIRGSLDAFPLELLEIQQTGKTVLGENPFVALPFETRDLRTQCERELKSEKLQLRRGLMEAAGRHARLQAICLETAQRSARVLRGVLHLLGEPPPAAAPDVLRRAAELTGVPLPHHESQLAGGKPGSFPAFEGLYHEVRALAAFVDGLGRPKPAGADSKK